MLSLFRLLVFVAQQKFDYALGGNFEEAEKINEYLSGMFSDLFVETNPIPVKYVVSKLGLCEKTYRMPLCDPSKDAQKVLDALINNYNLHE